jgi:hypothetical protein
MSQSLAGKSQNASHNSFERLSVQVAEAAAHLFHLLRHRRYFHTLPLLFLSFVVTVVVTVTGVFLL